MRRSLLLAGLLCALPPFARAADTPATSKIVAVDLFKNGLAVVRREATLGKPGTYVLDDVSESIHGTYWIESAAPVETLVRTREVEVPLGEVAPGNLQDDLAGKKVTIHFKGEKLPPVSGTILKIKPPKGEEASAPSRFLIVETPKGRSYVESSEIASVDSETGDGKVKRRRPQLVLTLGASDNAEAKIIIRYLARGMTWAPSYKVDISDPKTLTLEQHAVVKNELANLTDVEVRLISGFPSVQFGHVRSLLSPKSTLAVFFNELNSGGGRYADSMSNPTMNQMVVSNRTFHLPSAAELGAIPTGEGVDLHYESVGKRTLAEGDALSLTVGKGTAKYDRIVEWIVPDTRDAYGRGMDGHGHSEEDEPWDALRFRNPLKFAMTTGPAMVIADGKFNGQRTSYWTNAGEETVLRVDKALSVRTRSTETEDAKEGNRDLVWIGARQYRKTVVEGEVTVNNHRKETVQLVIRRRFSGELISAEGEPKSALREEGVYSVNKRNELLWTIPLKVGEERKLKYRYSVLVSH